MMCTIHFHSDWVVGLVILFVLAAYAYMAFTIRNHPKAVKLHILKEDMKCYKILNLAIKNDKAILISPFMNYEFKEGKVETVPYFREPPNKKEFEFKPEFLGKDLVNIFSGFNSFKNKQDAMQTMWHVRDVKKVKCYVFECIIPKGSKAYFDPVLNTIISNRIIITKVKHG